MHQNIGKLQAVFVSDTQQFKIMTAEVDKERSPKRPRLSVSVVDTESQPWFAPVFSEVISLSLFKLECSLTPG